MSDKGGFEGPRNLLDGAMVLYEREVTCDDTIDNDGDSETDCVDCASIRSVASPFEGIGDEVAERIVAARLKDDDSYDNDGDDLTDCVDDCSPPDQGEPYSQDCSPLPDGPNCQVDPDLACKPPDDDETI